MTSCQKLLYLLIAHDLRNPIGAIATIAGMMLEQHRPEDDRIMLDMIKTSGQNSLTLVSDLLQVHPGWKN
jgi:signal transduction histidine kinase